MRILAGLSCLLLFRFGSSVQEIDWVGGDEDEQGVQFIPVESKTPEDKEMDLRTECKKQCAKMSGDVSACNIGCGALMTTFDKLALQYPATKKSKLLGTALDDCWSGCDKVNAQYRPDCNLGCQIMREEVYNMEAGNAEADQAVVAKKGQNIEEEKKELKEANPTDKEEKPSLVKESQEIKINKPGLKTMDDKPAAKEEVLPPKMDGEPNKKGEKDVAKDVFNVEKAGTKVDEKKDVAKDVFNVEKAGTKVDEKKESNAAVEEEVFRDNLDNGVEDSDSGYIYIEDPVSFLRRLIFLRQMQSMYQDKVRGRLDDQEQLNLPLVAGQDEETASSGLLCKIKAAARKVATTVKQQVEMFGTRQFLLYIIIFMSAGLICMGLCDLVTLKRAEQPVPYTEDYYTLKKEPYNPVLPSYDDCIKMDKKDLAALHLKEEMEKECIATGYTPA